MRGRLLKRFIPTRSGGDISDDGCGAAWDGSSRLRLVPPEKAYCILRNKVGARAAMTTIVGASNTTFACLAAPRRARGMGLKTDDISPPTNARPDEFSCGQGYLLASRGRRAPLTGPHPRPRLRPAHGRFCPRACTRAAGRGGGSRAKRGHSRSKMGNETPKQKGSCGVLAKLFISLFYPPLLYHTVQDSHHRGSQPSDESLCCSVGHASNAWSRALRRVPSTGQGSMALFCTHSTCSADMQHSPTQR